MSTEIQRAELAKDLRKMSEADFLHWFQGAFRNMDEMTGKAASQAAEIGALRGLLIEARPHLARDDDLPDDLLPRIDAYIQPKKES